MNTESCTLSPKKMESNILAESTGSQLGQVVHTTAALELLEKLNLQVNYFLQWEVWSEGAINVKTRLKLHKED